ncbi:hypothetical protein N9164_09650 [Draconibacterium sp.]|nr:hypothetical protein [Draconibacterium sp.]
MDKNGEDLKCIFHLNTFGNKLHGFSYCIPRWSPKGDKIACMFIYGNESRLSVQEIIIIDSIGNNTNSLCKFEFHQNFTTSYGAPPSGISKSWSPDGNKIAFTKLEGGDVYHVHVIGVNTKKLHK